MSGGWVYIMTNRAYGVLYIGVTSSLPHRAMQHRDGTGSDFCYRYRLYRLVYAERHATIMEAIAREKTLKAWKRDWKIALVESINPKWGDLFDTLHLD
jgi:putative endonuclease